METRTLQQIECGALKALLALPAQPRGAPLLCFLHGFGEGAPMPLVEALTLHGPLSASCAVAAAEFVIVAPQLPVAGDLWHQHAATVQALVQQVQAQHGSDPARHYLSGFSYGANGVFDLAAAQPDVWAALWPVDPTRLPSPRLAPPAWLSIGATARPMTQAYQRLLRSQAPDEPLSADRVQLDEQVGHVECAQLAYADARIWRWLLARRRQT